MLQLAKDVGVVDESMQSFGDMTFEQVIESIHKLQENLGITGNTEKEAATTIEGTINQTKAAWENLLTALANPDEDITEPIQGLITAIVGEGEGEGLINQILPAVEAALTGIGQLIEQLVPVLLERLPQLLDENLPKLIDSALSILDSIVSALIDNADKIGEFITEMVQRFTQWIIENLPKILKAGMTILTELIKGLAKAMPELIPAIIECIQLIVETITDPETLSEIITAALDIVLAIVEGIIDNLDEIIDAIITVAENIVKTLLKPDVLTKIINASIRLTLSIIRGIAGATPDIIASVYDLLAEITKTIIETDWGKIGSDIIDGLWEGIQNMWGSLTSWWTSSWDTLVGGVKNLLGIHSPSKVFAGIGKNMVLGLSDGWDDEFGNAKKDIEDDMNFSANFSSSTIPTSGSAVGIHPVTIALTIENFYNSTDKDIETLADTLMNIINDRTRRAGAVYA